MLSFDGGFFLYSKKRETVSDYTYDGIVVYRVSTDTFTLLEIQASDFVFQDIADKVLIGVNRAGLSNYTFNLGIFDKRQWTVTKITDYGATGIYGFYPIQDGYLMPTASRAKANAVSRILRYTLSTGQISTIVTGGSDSYDAGMIELKNGEYLVTFIGGQIKIQLMYIA